MARILVTTFMTWRIFTRTELDMTADSFLDQSDPAIAALNEFRRQFGSDDAVFLVYRAKDGDVFPRASLTAAQQLTDDLRNWQSLNPADYPEPINGVEVDFNELNHIRRVQSITNVRFQENIGDTLLSNRLVPEQLPQSDAELAAIKARALADYVPAVDAANITLDDSFAEFDALATDNSFDLEYD